MPVTCDPALVARMLRNLRPTCGSRLTTGGLWSKPTLRAQRAPSKSAGRRVNAKRTRVRTPRGRAG